MYRMHTESVSDVSSSSRSKLPGITANLRTNQQERKRSNTEQIRNGELFRPMKRVKYMWKGQGRPGKKQPKNRTNIDAYFDLSCLKGVKQLDIRP